MFTGHIAYYIQSKHSRDSSVINRIYGQDSDLAKSNDVEATRDLEKISDQYAEG